MNMKECEPEGLGELVCPVVLACRSAQVGGAKAGQEQGQEEIENLDKKFTIDKKYLDIDKNVCCDDDMGKGTCANMSRKDL